MTYDFEHDLPRRGTYSLKWDDDNYFYKVAPGIRLDKDTIRLMIADYDFECAPAIKAAMHRVAECGNYGYTTAEAAPEFFESIIGWYKRRYGYEIDPSWIVYAEGALEGVGRTIDACSEPGDGVILCGPVYSNFRGVIEGHGRKIVNCQKPRTEAGYTMDWERFEALCARPENKLFILCSPENPVGRIWQPDELRRMADICRKNGVVIVSDEIHSDFVRKGEHHTPILQAVEDHSNIVMVSGANKSFNLLGLHCAYSVIPDEALRTRYTHNYIPNPPTPFAIAGTVAAYNESEDWLDALNAYFDEALAWAAAYIEEKLPKAKATVPQATYFLWVDFSGYGYPQDLLQYLVNHKANVAVQGGTSHDPELGDNYLRFALVCSKATFKEAIDRIADAFEAFQNENGGRS